MVAQQISQAFADWLLKKILQMQVSRQYGSIELTFKEGEIVSCKVVITEKPPR